MKVKKETFSNTNETKSNLQFIPRRKLDLQ